MDADGKPIPNAIVRFEIDAPPGAAGHKADPAEVATNADGIATVTFTLGDKPGKYKVIVEIVEPAVPSQ